MHWFRQIDHATSAGDIVAIARDYLATWTPGDLAKLPCECRPGRVKSPGDLEQLHACLVDECRQDRLQGEELSALQRLTSFVVRASVRLAQIEATEGAGGPSRHGPAEGRPEADREG